MLDVRLRDKVTIELIVCRLILIAGRKGERGMADESKREEFFRRAEEADREADKAVNLETAEKWRRIAGGYRDLAELARLDIL